MTSREKAALLRVAVAAVRGCADAMETQAAGLLQALPTVAISEGLRVSALGLAVGLEDASSRVTFELALLQTEMGEGKADTATVVERLSAMDATMMSAVAALTDVVDQLEQAAERDEQVEPAFVLMIEAVGVMLQGIEKAKAATQALGAADDSVVILQAGAEGGDVTLIGRATDAGTWVFARVTDDQAEALFGQSGVPIAAPPALKPDDWVESWDDGLRLMDRYPWTRLYPLRVHPEFVDRVRAAVEERLATISRDDAEDAREKWERVFLRSKAR